MIVDEAIQEKLGDRISGGLRLLDVVSWRHGDALEHLLEEPGS